MNTLNTILFPETTIADPKLYPTMLFCLPIHILNSVEDGSDKKKGNDTQFFLEHGYCKAFTPQPLGKNRQSFIELINTLVESKDLYSIQESDFNFDKDFLSNSTEQVSSKHAGFSNLLKEFVGEDISIVSDLEVWHARLNLALAEILDCEEKALHEQIFIFNDDELAAIHSLASENNSADQYLYEQIVELQRQFKEPRSENIRLRTRAWIRLIQSGPVPQAALWLASTYEAADSILNKHKSSGSARPAPLLKLEIPAYFNESKQYVVKTIEDFHQKTKHIHAGLVDDFNRIISQQPYIPGSPDFLLPFETDWADQWEAIVYDMFPNANYGRNDITFYLLPNQNVFDIEASAYPESNKTNNALHGLLAVLGDGKD